MKLIRRFAAILAGLLAGGVSVGLIEWGNALRYPMPDGLKLDDVEGIGKWIKTLPADAFATLAIAWAVGSFVGAFVASRLVAGRRAYAGCVVMGLLTAATIFNLINLPHPLWLWPVGVGGCLIFGTIGVLLAAPASYVVTTSRQIKASIETVFGTIADISNYCKAVPGITKVEFLSYSNYGIGTRFRETRIMQGKEASTELEVTELTENQSIRFVSNEGGTIWDTVFTVESGGNVTQMNMQMDVVPKSVFAKLITPVILGMVSKTIEQDMDSVQAYCEAVKN